jgi:hypothetical protein
MIWTDDIAGNNEIYLRRSTDSGVSFDPTVNLSSNLASSVKPQISVSGNSVYVVWQDPNAVRPYQSCPFI